MGRCARRSSKRGANNRPGTKNGRSGPRKYGGRSTAQGELDRTVAQARKKRQEWGGPKYTGRMARACSDGGVGAKELRGRREGGKRAGYEDGKSNDLHQFLPQDEWGICEEEREKSGHVGFCGAPDINSAMSGGSAEFPAPGSNWPPSGD